MMKNKPVKWLVCCFCLVTTWTITGPLLLGQIPQGAITGTVTDSSGAAIVDAQILLIDRDTGRKFQASTDSKGIYVCQGVWAGVYDLRVIVRGFTIKEVGSVVIAPAQSQTLNVVVG